MKKNVVNGKKLERTMLIPLTVERMVAKAKHRLSINNITRLNNTMILSEMKVPIL